MIQHALSTKGTYSILQKTAGSGLLNFILHTQKDIVPHLCNPVRYQRNRHLSIDANTRRALEIIKWVLYSTVKLYWFS